MTYQKSWLTRLSVMALAATAVQGWAQQSQPSDKPAVKTNFQQIEATVESIDPASREVTLRGPKGRLVGLTVGPEAKNFDKVHAGDKVVVSYYEGIAAQMSKGNVKVAEPAESTFAYGAGANKPGGGVGASATTTVKIEDVDLGTNTVAFRRPDGAVRIIAVQSPEMRKFIRTLKPGDSVDVTYTESVAVDVVPAAGKSASAATSNPH